MKKILNPLSFTLLLLLTIISVDLNAAHIVGGSVSYRFQSFNADTTRVTFLIEIEMYRDAFSDGAPFDPNAVFGIFRQNLNGGWEYIDDVSASPSPVQPVPSVDDPCVEEPDNVGVEQTTYSFLYTFDIINTSYMIAYQRCCRNNSITNIFDPGDTGAVFSIEITPEGQMLGNSSPIFNQFPPIFLCANQDFNFDHSASDRDAVSDEIRYSFCAPLQAGGVVDAQTGGNMGCCDCVRPNPARCTPPFNDVVFSPPYTSVAPMAGNPVISIDNVTGEITGSPTLTGQYVVGVCAEEYRDGQLISVIRRDFQFNVVPCSPAVVAQFDYDIIADGNPMDDDCDMFEINSCGETSLTILNDSQSPANIFSYHWTFFNPDGTVLSDVVGGNEVRDLDITFPGIGQYDGQMILNEGSECSDTACFFVNIFPSIEADFSFDYDTCVAGPVDFTDLSSTGAMNIVEWEWNYGDGNRSSLQNPIHEFEVPGDQLVSLRVEDNNECVAIEERMIRWFPVPQLIIVEPTTFVGCLPADIFFNNLSSPIDSSYFIQWDFGDGNNSTEISPTHEYLETGTYDVSVVIESPIGCTTSEVFNDWIRVLDAPQADFTFSPEEPNNFTDAVSFTDMSVDAAAWQWSFGGAGNSFQRNPNFAFPDTGRYEVLLTVFHPITNCPDTVTKLVDITPLATLFLPNAFTPNNDGKNDDFRGKGYLEGLSDYNMSIFNRWGQMIYQSTDPNIGWNGQDNNSGALSPQGVYVYKVSYRDPRGERKVLEGHVTLIR